MAAKDEAHEAAVETLFSPTDGIEKPPITTKQYFQVLSAFTVFMNTWGLLLTFGTFQAYYEQILLTDRSSSDIAWISTTCGFILLVSGMVTGPLFDFGFHRPLLLIGGLLEVLGLMMLSLSTRYYQVFLSQGICLGLGGGMVYIPSIAAASKSLQEFRRAKFMGIIASGVGIGGVIYPIVFRRLLSTIGFGWAVRVIGFLVLTTYLLSWPILLYKPANSGMVRRWIDLSAFTDFPFLLAIFGALVGSMGYYLPILFLPLFSETGSVHLTNTDLAFYLVSIVNAASIVGRLLAGLLATVIGPIETCLLALAGSSILLFCWIAVKSTAGIIVWSVVWGLVSSVVVAMPGAMVPLLSPSLAVIGTRTGMYWVGGGVGILIGGPIAGTLVNDRSSHIRWIPVQVFAGVLMAAGALSYLYPVISVRRKARAALI